MINKCVGAALLVMSSYAASASDPHESVTLHQSTEISAHSLNVASAHADSPAPVRAVPRGSDMASSMTPAEMIQRIGELERAVNSLKPTTSDDHSGAVPVPSGTRWAILPEDGSISATFARWAKIAGYQLAWEIPRDYPVTITDTYTGSFENAIRYVTGAFQIGDYPPWPCFHTNHVVRIVRRVEGNNAECSR